MIKIENLTKKFGSNKVLSNASFNINPEETIAIVGPSGSGKSTLLRCINRLEEPTSGSISLNDKKITARNAHKVNKYFGMVFQQFNLFPHMSVMENLTYAATRVHQMQEQEAQTKAISLLTSMNLENKAECMPDSLSGGQKQRVAIARALMNDPKLVLFDEPTSALDPEVTKEVIEVIRKLKSDKITMLIVTHHIHFAKAVADRIIFMDKGLILEDSPKDIFFKKPKSQRARLFLESMII